MRFPIESDAFQFMIPLMVVTVVFYFLNWTFATWTTIGLLLFVAYFFRDLTIMAVSDIGCIASTSTASLTSGVATHRNTGSGHHRHAPIDGSTEREGRSTEKQVC